MVKLTVTIAAAVAAAAVIVEGSPDPGSPLSPHSQYLRDGRSSSIGVGLGPSDSDADEPPPHDFSRDLEQSAGDKRSGILRGGHHHHNPPPNAGSAGLGLDGNPQPGSRSFDGRLLPPSLDTGNGEMPPFPDRGPFRKGHPKNFGKKNPDSWGPPPPPPPPPGASRLMGSPQSKVYNANKRPGCDEFDDPAPSYDQNDDMPPLGSGVGPWHGSASEGFFPPQSDFGCDFAPPFPWQDGQGDRATVEPQVASKFTDKFLDSHDALVPSPPNVHNDNKHLAPNGESSGDNVIKPRECNPLQPPKSDSGSSDHKSNVRDASASALTGNSQ